MIIHTKSSNLLTSSSIPTRRFYLSPLRELRWALHVLSSPGHHGVFLRWALGVRERLEPSFIERVDRLAPFFLMGLPAMTDPAINEDSDGATFKEEWEAYMALSEEQLTTHHQHFKHRWTQDFDLRLARHSEWESWAHMAAREWWIPWEHQRTRLRDEIGMVMKDFWDQEFISLWAQIIADMQRDIIERQREAAVDSPTAWWQHLSPRIRIEHTGGPIWVLVPWKTEIIVSSTTYLALFPSVFCWPHMWVEGTQDRLNITYQSQAIIDWASPVPTSGHLERLLEIMSEPTRFLIVRHLFGTMGTTSSVARVLRLSPSTISRHLTLLHSSGLVDRIAMGHYALYRTNRGVLLSVARDLEQLERPPVPAFLGWE